MGEQVTPTSTSTPPSIIPSRPRRVEMSGSLELWTLLQHCKEPVEQDCVPSGVATARVTTDARETIFANFIVEDE